MSIYKSSARYLRDCKIKTFEQYMKDFKYEYVVVADSIETMDSNKLIKLIQQKQAKHNTTDLRIRTEVTDSYYEEASIVIERKETDNEFESRVRALYEYELQGHKNAMNREERELEIEMLKKQQDEIQTKIKALQ